MTFDEILHIFVYIIIELLVMKLKNILSGFNTQSTIVEVKLSRIWQYISNKNSVFGIVSAYRQENSKEENEAKYDKLHRKIKNDGYGYIMLRGGFTEKDIMVEEKSFFIPNIKRDDVIDFGIEYGQYSIIHKDKLIFEEIGTNRDSGINVILNKFSIKSNNNISFAKEIIKKYYSSLMYGPHHKKKFAFKLQEQESSSFNRIAYHNEPLKWYTVLTETYN